MQVDLASLRARAHRQLIGITGEKDKIDRVAVGAVVESLAPLLDPTSTQRVIDAVLADVHGLGPLKTYLGSEDITDIMVVGDKGVWIERNGEIEDTNLVLPSNQVEHLIERIVAPLGLRVDRSSPMVDARLADGSRVNAVLPPLAIDGPCLTIRRFAAHPIELGRIAAPPVASLLVEAMQMRMNVLISGGTGAGKTTLLNALAALIDRAERVITVEDAAELRLPIRHVVRLESRAANSEGAGLVTLRDLVRNALRMRPDRIIVGEIRGPEALDMLQAMNTGHEGSMSTCHANSSLDALYRVETMVLMGGVALPLAAVRQQIASSLDLVVQIARCDDGVRRVTEVAEVVEVEGHLSVRRIADVSSVLQSLRRPPRRSAVLS